MFVPRCITIVCLISVDIVDRAVSWAFVITSFYLNDLPSALLYAVLVNDRYEYRYFILLTVSQLYNRMNITNRFKLTISPLRLHSASFVRIPHSINNFRTMLPSVLVRPINLFSAASVNFSGAGNTNMFKNHLRIRLSSLKSPILRKYTNPFKRSGMYPSISKCNAKKCRCCSHLCTSYTVSSSVNGRRFSVVNMSDLT